MSLTRAQKKQLSRFIVTLTPMQAKQVMALKSMMDLNSNQDFFNMMLAALIMSMEKMHRQTPEGGTNDEA